MDFHESDDLAAYRAAAGDWMKANFEPAWVEEQLRTGTYHTWDLHKKMAADGILGAGWPKEYGGTDMDPDLALAIMQAIHTTGAHLDGWVTTEMVMRTVLSAGTEEQKQRWVPQALAGEMIIVLGYTEPGNGSDAAAASMRAIKDGDDWVLNGSKMFTSTAHVGTHVFLITRTNLEVSKHRGLTMFLVPLDLPGIDCQPVYTLGGQRTNATYYTDVHTGDDNRVGDVDGGWGVMRVALVHERAVGAGPSGPTWVQRGATWAQETVLADGSHPYDDPTVRAMLAQMGIHNEVSKLLRMKNMWATTSGSMTGIEGAVNKVWSSEKSQADLAALSDMVGAAALVELDYSRHAEQSTESFPGDVEKALRNSVVGTIYGGSTEIMRGIVAERQLGLPRTRTSA